MDSCRYIHWKQLSQLECSRCPCVLYRGGVCHQNKCATWERKKKTDTNATETWRCRGLYTAGNGYFWSLRWRTNYTQATAELHVTLSNFYPIVCVHTSRPSYQYVCVLYLSEGERESVWTERRRWASYLCICLCREYSVCVCACVCVCVCGGPVAACLALSQSRLLDLSEPVVSSAPV